jgi:hypothetical protein
MGKGKLRRDLFHFRKEGAIGATQRAEMSFRAGAFREHKHSQRPTTFQPLERWFIGLRLRRKEAFVSSLLFEWNEIPSLS